MQQYNRQRSGGRLRAAIQPAIASTTMISASAMPRAARVSQSICRPAHASAPNKVLKLGYPQPKDRAASRPPNSAPGRAGVPRRGYSFEEMICATARRAAGSGKFGWYRR